MSMDDSDFMLEMKNYPETRQFAIATHDEVKKEDHEIWLPNNIQYFQVIEDENKNRLGALRIQDNEISIWINRKYRQSGIATAAINMVSTPGIIAKIVDGNIGSFRAFINAGFKPIEHRDNYYILQKKLLRIILIGYPGSQKITAASMYLTLKYLPGFDITYLNYAGDVKGWAQYLSEYLQPMSDEYIIFSLDDYLISDTIERSAFAFALAEMGGNTVCAKLCYSTPEEHEEYPVKGVLKVDAMY